LLKTFETSVSDYEITNFKRLKLDVDQYNEERDVAELQEVENVDMHIAYVGNTSLPRERRLPRDLSLDKIIGQIDKGISIRKCLNLFLNLKLFLMS